MATDGIVIRDMTAQTPAKKSRIASSVWFITSVYHRSVRKMTPEGPVFVPDYNEFKAYLNERVADFYDNYFRQCLVTPHPELQNVQPSLRFDIALEINDRGILHHHCTVEASYPRIVDEADPKGRLMRIMIDYTALNRIFREVVVLAMGDGRVVAIKLQVENVKTNSLENLKNYILKHDG
jgi:hypothetical protein